MHTNQILFQGITLEQFQKVISNGIEEQLKKLLVTSEPQKNEYLTRKEVAALLSISLPTLHDWSKKKILNPYRMGNRVYFKSEEVNQSLKQINHSVNVSKSTRGYD